MSSHREGLRGALQAGGQFFQRLSQRRSERQQQQQERQQQQQQLVQKTKLSDLLGGREQKRKKEFEIFKAQLKQVTPKVTGNLVELAQTDPEAAAEISKLLAFSRITDPLQLEFLREGGFDLPTVLKNVVDALDKFGKRQPKVPTPLGGAGIPQLKPINELTTEEIERELGIR